MNIPFILQNMPDLILGIIFILCLIIYAIIRFPVYRLRGRHYACFQSTAEQQPVSVVITTHNQAAVLEQTLEAIATQDYPNYEIIVVNDASTDETADVIQRAENKYPHIRHTFTPTSARYVSHSKLAITLGIRSAKNEWVLLTEGDCRPVGNQWISKMAAASDDDHDFVIGYSNFEPAQNLFAKRISIDRLMHQLRFFHAAAAYSRSKAIGGGNCNIALRKSVFLQHKGFSSNLNLLGGEDQLFLDATALPGRTGVVTDPEAAMVQQLPAIHQQWNTFKLFQAEAARRLSFRGQLERYLWALSSLAMYAAFLLAIALIIINLIKDSWAMAGGALLLSVLTFSVDQILFNSAAGILQNNTYHFLLPCYNVTQPFFNLHYRIQSRLQRHSLMRGV
jgi:glycosyltransferase involved in cell wall biosynthesis